MENLKVIKTRLKTIDSIIKATNAMKMVSSVKLNRLNNRNKFSKACSEILLNILGKALIEAEFRREVPKDSWFMRKDGKTLVVVLSADQGFCGSFNQNIINMAKDVVKNNEGCYVEVFGKKAASIHEPREVQDKFDIRNFAKRISDLTMDYIINKEVQNVFVVFGEFKNVLVQKPKCQKIFPVPSNSSRNEFSEIEGDMIDLLDDLLYEYLFKFFNGCLTEHLFSELSARVMAMDNSVKNAKNMLEELNALYNRVRQARITQELTEIVSSIECVQ